MKNKNNHLPVLLDSAHEQFQKNFLRPKDFSSSFSLLFKLVSRSYYLLWVLSGIVCCVISYFLYDYTNKYYDTLSEKISSKKNLSMLEDMWHLGKFLVIILCVYLTTHFHTWIINYFFYERIRNDLLVYTLQVDSICLDGKETMVIKAMSDLPLYLTQFITKISVQLYSVILVALILKDKNNKKDDKGLTLDNVFYLCASMFVIIMIYVGYKFYHHMQEISEDIAEIYGNITVRISDIINNRKIIDLFKQGVNEYGKILEYKHVLDEKQNTKTGTLSALSCFAVIVNALIAIVYILWLCYQQYNNQISQDESILQLNIEDKSTILQLSAKLIIFCKAVSDFLINLLSSLEINLLILDNLQVFKKMTISKETGSISYNTIQQSIHMDKIQVLTPDNKILIEKNICPVVLEPGNIYALLGKSGSGKSTLMNILHKLYFNFTGEIKIDNILISKINSGEYKDLLSIIPQRYELMQRSLRENITFSHETWHDKSIIDIMETVDLKEFLKSTDYNLDYQIIRGGSNISGGQAQRICIARALYKIYKGAKILVADEPFSALDRESANRVFSMLKKIAQDQKVIVIIIDHTGLAAGNSVKNLLIHNKKLYFDSKQELLKSNPEFSDLYYKS